MSNENIEVIILGAIGSIIGAIIMYSIIRLYKSIPKFRKKYIVSLHIETIQGYSDIHTNKSLNYLFLIFPISLFIISIVSMSSLNTQVQKIEKRYYPNSTEQNITSCKKVKTEFELQEMKKKLIKLKKEVNVNLSQIKNIVERTHTFVKIPLAISILWFYWLLLYSIPYNLQRDKLSFKYKRLRNLLFKLMLKEEKIKLFNQEILVKDEVTLKQYTTLLIEYTEKNKINNVKDVMWIWDDKIDI